SGDYRTEVKADGRGARLLSAEGGPALGYSGLKAWDARGKVLPARMVLSGGMLDLRVADAGAVYPVTIDPLLTAETELTAGDAAAEDRFGESVALSGGAALVGAYTKNSSAGAAYVFLRRGGAWSQQQKLTAADAAANDYFGISVALSGETALVGAYGK